ncbi:MAG TPA: C45 family peptidase [Chthoniobacteraceae bacterium]|nr:C45 family peptidase [Chthoniobacteraceae bacterium]
MSSPLFRFLRRVAALVLLLCLLALVNVGMAFWLLSRQYDLWREAVAAAHWPISTGTMEVEISGKKKHYSGFLARDREQTRLEIALVGDEKLSPVRYWRDGEGQHLAAAPKGSHFVAPLAGSGPAVREAVREVAEVLPELRRHHKLLALLALRPRITGWASGGEGPAILKIRFAQGSAEMGVDGHLRSLQATVHGWKGAVRVDPKARPFADAGPTHGSRSPGKPVPAAELATSFAETLRIAALPLTPFKPEPDHRRRSGKGWLEVRGGHYQMYLEGSPYEIGHQHGSLAPEQIARSSQRLIYGVGLLYSLRAGEWFPQAARKLVERQRPFIAPAYFEEMKGLADGAQVPLETVQAVNLFPEFFHCSGAALMGEATVGGELLHARVLDYMVGIGLQDDAVVMAVTRPGANRFVSVGYLGFIGSVTGMNEQKVAIGEMGGAGEGEWDGIPMSLLIRQALETCDTADAVVEQMRQSPRTCEYYYLISDGKGPSAVGVKATPTLFETFRAGEWHPQLTEPVEDALLLSGKGRYEKLAERVKADYGKIDEARLIEIIKTPVAMRSNLHNVIFRPQSLRLSVADAVRNGPACDQPYRTYTWDSLFAAKP